MCERPPLQTVLMLFLFIFLAGCRPGSILTGSTAIKATITQGSYRPSYWQVPGGAKITLTLINQDPVSHYWTVLRDPVTLPNQNNRHYTVFFQAEVHASGTTTTQFTAPLAPGEYDVVGEPPYSDAKGIVGTLLVVQP